MSDDTKLNLLIAGAFIVGVGVWVSSLYIDMPFTVRGAGQVLAFAGGVFGLHRILSKAFPPPVDRESDRLDPLIQRSRAAGTFIGRFRDGVVASMNSSMKEADSRIGKNKGKSQTEPEDQD